MARVSIVIPAYNAEKTISYCIESVLSQSFEDLEIIIVDDGSTDDTRIVVSNYAQTDPRIICISQENMGRSIARNNGIAESSGEWITFLDADDFLDVDALNLMIEKAVNVFDKNDAIFLKKFIDETDLLIDDIFSEKEIPKRLRENFIALELSAVWCKAAASKEPIIDVIDGFKVFFRNDRVQSILRCNPAIGRPRKIACCIRFFLLSVNCPFLALLVDRALSRIM